MQKLSKDNILDVFSLYHMKALRETCVKNERNLAFCKSRPSLNRRCLYACQIYKLFGEIPQAKRSVSYESQWVEDNLLLCFYLKWDNHSDIKKWVVTIELWQLRTRYDEFDALDANIKDSELRDLLTVLKSI